MEWEGLREYIACGISVSRSGDMSPRGGDMSPRSGDASPRGGDVSQEPQDLSTVVSTVETIRMRMKKNAFLGQEPLDNWHHL